MNYIKIFIILLAFIYSSCNKTKEDSDHPLACVYKIKDTTYFNYVVATLTKDSKSIAGHPGPSVNYKKYNPILLDSNYYYESNYRHTSDFAVGAEKTVVLDVKISEYTQLFNSDTMMNHILDKDPFIEYYQYDFPSIRGCKSLAEDTAKLNEWIRNGELGKYLKRLK
jgi:hypothetical protein